MLPLHATCRRAKVEFMRDDTDSTSPVDDLVRDRLEHSPRAVADVLAEAVAVLRSSELTTPISPSTSSTAGPG